MRPVPCMVHGQGEPGWLFVEVARLAGLDTKRTQPGPAGNLGVEGNGQGLRCNPTLPACRYFFGARAGHFWAGESMRPYGEQHRCSGTRTSKPRHRWSIIRASVRRQIKKRARAAGALALLLSGCATGAQTWPQVVDSHALIAAGVAYFALVLAARVLVAPWRALAARKTGKAAQVPDDDDTARVVAANIKRAIDGMPPRLAHPPAHYIGLDPRSPQ